MRENILDGCAASKAAERARPDELVQGVDDPAGTAAAASRDPSTKQRAHQPSVPVSISRARCSRSGSSNPIPLQPSSGESRELSAPEDIYAEPGDVLTLIHPAAVGRGPRSDAAQFPIAAADARSSNPLEGPRANPLPPTAGRANSKLDGDGQ